MMPCWQSCIRRAIKTIWKKSECHSRQRPGHHVWISVLLGDLLLRRTSLTTLLIALRWIGKVERAALLVGRVTTLPYATRPLEIGEATKTKLCSTPANSLAASHMIASIAFLDAMMTLGTSFHVLAL